MSAPEMLNQLQLSCDGSKQQALAITQKPENKANILYE
jgi:hypothetical protein